VAAGDRGAERALRHHSATDVLEHALTDSDTGRVALVSSFGAESVVLLHMVALTDRTTPVLFIDTEMLFTETLAYQREVAERLGLRDVRSCAGRATRPPGPRWAPAPDRSRCLLRLRKTAPLQRAGGFDAWITGRKRFQGGSARRWSSSRPSRDGPDQGQPAGPLGAEDVQDYMINNRLPRHPLVARAIRRSAARPAPAAWRGRGPARRALARHRTRTNAASISSTEGTRRRRRRDRRKRA
jgi:phosphoadenosine phosphosulfate reductase